MPVIDGNDVYSLDEQTLAWSLLFDAARDSDTLQILDSLMSHLETETDHRPLAAEVVPVIIDVCEIALKIAPPKAYKHNCR